MNAVRTLVRDLIDRKLLPVALLLVAAAVAIPVLLGRAPAPAPTTLPAPAAPAADAPAKVQKAEVTLEAAVPADRDRTGAVHDPFKVPKKKATASSTSASGSAMPGMSGTPSVAAGGTSSVAPPSTDTGTSTSTPSTGSDTTTPSSGSGSGGSGSTSTPTAPKATKPKADDPSDTYHVSVRFGVNGAETKTVRDIARLSPVPSVTDPFFVYLGVIETATTHEKRAVFLVSSDATPNGEGSCHPTKNDCESVELAVGQTAYFDYTAPGGVVTQYQLELAGIHKTAVQSDAKASAAFARHSVAGAELLGDAAKRNVRAAAGARAYRYLPGAGLLTRAKRKHVTAKAAAAGTLIPGIALLSRKHQPGIPVWHSPNK
jgi:hypothetical protein